jgi:hypothetical protein
MIRRTSSSACTRFCRNIGLDLVVPVYFLSYNPIPRHLTVRLAGGGEGES